MNAFRTGLAAALLAVGSAHAQLADPAEQARLRAQPSPQAGAFARTPSLFERGTIRDEGAHPFTRLFEGYRTDPRLVAGFRLDRHLALELGYLERLDRGFHPLDPHSAFDTTGALGVRGFHTYAAVKASVPITEDLSAYGKLGVAYSERRGIDGRGKAGSNTDFGAYTGLGARYRLNEKAAVSVESQKFGNTSQKWGSDTNANKVNATLHLGF